jgi:hypothetical protein
MRWLCLVKVTLWRSFNSPLCSLWHLHWLSAICQFRTVNFLKHGGIRRSYRAKAIADCRMPELIKVPVSRLMNKGGQTAILVRWNAAQRTTKMLADQQTGKNSGPAPADYRNRASAIPLFWILAYLKKYLEQKKLSNNGVQSCGAGAGAGAGRSQNFWPEPLYWSFGSGSRAN